MAKLNGQALAREGFDGENNTIQICKRCHHCLKYRRQRPHVSLANDFVFGDMPPELADLTWAEQRLISLYRVTIHVLYFRNEDLPGQRDSPQAPKKTKTHSSCVPQDTIGTNQLLPPPPTSLPEIMQVSFFSALVAP
jgi:hypothetical protein